MEARERPPSNPSGVTPFAVLQGGDNVVDSLMSKLSLEEKIGQMTQIAVGAIWDVRIQTNGGNI